MKLLFAIVILKIFSAVSGQSGILQGVVTRCYSTDNCTGDIDEARCLMFNRSMDGDLNHCCFDGNLQTPRMGLGSYSFTLNGGMCRRCDDISVINTQEVTCLDTCDNVIAGVGTTMASPSRADASTGNGNTCCRGNSADEYYTTTFNASADMNSCTLCHEIGLDATIACDPHFFLPLANGDHMCFSVQGEPDFAFNLINDKYIKLNGQFVLPAEDESHTISDVSTFLGDLGLMIKNPKTGNTTNIIVHAVDHSVVVGDSLTVVKDMPVTVDVFKTVSININSHVQTTKLKDESAWLYINTDGFGIKIRFYKKHLDMILTKTDGLTKDAHGLIGQFLIADVKIDAEGMIMKLGDRMPISVKKNKAWPFLGIDEECWYGANTDNQGTGIIEGSYLDYVVEHLIPK